MIAFSAPIARRSAPAHSRAVFARAEERTPSPAAQVLEEKVQENKDEIKKVTGVDPTLPSSKVDVDSGENTTVTNILSRTQELVNGRVRFCLDSPVSGTTIHTNMQSYFAQLCCRVRDATGQSSLCECGRSTCCLHWSGGWSGAMLCVMPGLCSVL